MKSYWEMSFYSFDSCDWCEVEVTIQASTKFGCLREFLNTYNGWNGRVSKKQQKEVYYSNLPTKVTLPVITSKRLR